MQAPELTKEIYDKYPKVWRLLVIRYHGYMISDILKIDIPYNIKNILFSSRYNGWSSIPFNMLYGLLEDFFEENEIIITYHYFTNRGWDSTYLDNKTGDMYTCGNKGYLKTRDEAKYQAIIKACEILEER